MIHDMNLKVSLSFGLGKCLRRPQLFELRCSPWQWDSRVLVISFLPVWMSHGQQDPSRFNSHTYYYGNANVQSTGTLRAAPELECVSGGDGTDWPHFSLQLSSACEDVPFSLLFLCCAQNSPRAPVHRCLLVVCVLACWRLGHPSVADDTLPQEALYVC